MSDLGTIFPDVELELSSGELIKVRPFKFGQLPKVLNLSKDIFAQVQALFIANAQIEDAALIAEVLSSGGEKFIELLCVSINKPRAFFDELDAADGIRLATAVLEVNVSFFAQRLLPELKKSALSLQAATPGLKQLSS
jgi:hypothetical protein